MASPHAPAGSASRELMTRAIRLGRRGWGRVHPNPMVGCVIVREGTVVGEGWHQEFGGPHAEVRALEQAGEAARGAEVYVSVEPCRHEGKTPACTRALITAGVGRVVFGAADPGDESGGGSSELRAAGVEVEGPTLSSREAAWENPFFFHRDPTRPWMALKLALSLDAKLSSGAGIRTRLSGEEAHAEVHRLRAGFDAILVGTRTVLVDDPLLTVRGPVDPRVPPRRILLDARGVISANACVFREGEGEVWVVTTPASSPDWQAEVGAAGARVLEVPGGERGRVSLNAALGVLASEGVRTILSEGGGVLGSELIRQGLVDRLYLVMAPLFLGGGGVPAFPGLGPEGEHRVLREGAGIGGGWTPGEDPRRLGRDVWIAMQPEEA